MAWEKAQGETWDPYEPLKKERQLEGEKISFHKTGIKLLRDREKEIERDISEVILSLRERRNHQR